MTNKTVGISCLLKLNTKNEKLKKRQEKIWVKTRVCNEAFFYTTKKTSDLGEAVRGRVALIQTN